MLNHPCYIPSQDSPQKKDHDHETYSLIKISILSARLKSVDLSRSACIVLHTQERDL